MVAYLRKMQENQGFSENRIDKLEFVVIYNYLHSYISLALRRLTPYNIVKR